MDAYCSCMDPDENTYLGGKYSNAGNQGIIVKLTYDGHVDWVMQNSAYTAAYHTGFYNVACAKSFVYGFGDSGQATLTNVAGQYVFYFVKFHSSQKLIYAKNAYTSTNPHTDYCGGGNISPDGQYVYIFVRSNTLNSGGENTRVVKFKAADGSMIMAKGTISGGTDTS